MKKSNIVLIVVVLGLIALPIAVLVAPEATLGKVYDGHEARMKVSGVYMFTSRPAEAVAYLEPHINKTEEMWSDVRLSEQQEVEYATEWMRYALALDESGKAQKAFDQYFIIEQRWYGEDGELGVIAEDARDTRERMKARDNSLK